LPVESAVFDRVAALLGRKPRGLQEVAVWNDEGEPAVIRVASLVDQKPFPTLYWLIDPGLSYAIDQAEAGGLIQHLQQVVNERDDLQAAMRLDHQSYIATRARFMSEAVREQIRALGFESVFDAKGIGGIGDFTRIRCLHTWYAAHLVEANTIGRLLDDYWRRDSSLV